MYDRWAKSDEPPPGNDIHLIAPMVIYLGESWWDIQGERREAPGHYYTCKHYDCSSQNCGIYEHRPRMCSEYPYGRDCNYLDCTMTENCGVVAREPASPSALIPLRFTPSTRS